MAHHPNRNQALAAVVKAVQAQVQRQGSTVQQYIEAVRSRPALTGGSAPAPPPHYAPPPGGYPDGQTSWNQRIPNAMVHPGDPAHPMPQVPVAPNPASGAVPRNMMIPANLHLAYIQAYQASHPRISFDGYDSRGWLIGVRPNGERFAAIPPGAELHST